MSVDFKEKYRSLRASKLFEADLSILEVMLKDFEKQVNHFSKLVKKDKINADRFKYR